MDASTANGIVLLPSKINMPSPVVDAVDRPAVREKLERALACPLTTVVSAAGHGKTTAVVSWAKNLGDVPVAWYLLDAEDRALDRFWLYLTSALREADERICHSFDEVALSAEFASTQPALDSLIVQMGEYEHDFVCVLEDFHVVGGSQDVAESMRYMLRRLPSNVHFVITSRGALPLPLAKLRVEGLLNEVGETDLRFSQRETASFLAGKGLRLTSHDVEAVHEVTRGWATGMCLFALLAQGRSRTQVGDVLARAREGIDDYLLEEVFSVLSEEERRFLVATSVVGSFCVSLAEAVTGISHVRAAAMVDGFIKNGLFVERIEREHGEVWYRYHRLFADFLQGRLMCEDVENVARWRRSARDWLEENGFLDYVVELSAALGDYEKIRQVIINSWMGLYMSDALSTLLRWSSLLPDDVLMRSPLICAVLAMPYAMRGDVEKSNSLIRTAVERLHDDEDFLFALCMAQKAYLYSFVGDADNMRAFAEKALRFFPEEEFYLRGMMLQIQAASLCVDDPLAGKAAFSRAVELQRGYGNKNLSCSAYCNLARVCANLGHLGEAEYWAHVAIELYDERERRFKPMLAHAYLTLMICRYERGDAQGTLDAHALFASASAEGKVPAPAAEARAVRAKALYRTGASGARQAFFEALSFNESGALSCIPSLAMARDYADSFRTRAFELCEASTDETPVRLFSFQLAYWLDRVAVYEDLCFFVESIDEEERLAKTHGEVLVALFSEKVARFERAVFWLSSAALHATVYGLKQPLRESATFLQPVARRLLAERPSDPSVSLVRDLVSPEDVPAAASQLTSREIDVVKLVADGLTVIQVAERLFVSRDTVKKHLSNVYAKLDVHSKMQAVAMLREEGVI